MKQPQNYFQKTTKAGKNLAQFTWGGPGKFFVVIFIGCIIVGIHENYFLAKDNLSQPERLNRHTNFFRTKAFADEAEERLGSANNATLIREKIRAALR
jgi:hypothetical protein